MKARWSVAGLAAALLVVSPRAYADCMTLNPVSQYEALDVLLSGRAVSVQVVRRNPEAHLVTFHVDRVWKGNVGPIFAIYNVPTDWTPSNPTQYPPTPEGLIHVPVAGRTPGVVVNPFTLNAPIVLAARRLSALERAQLNVEDERERFGTAMCRDGRWPIGSSPWQHALTVIGPGRVPE